MPQMAPIMWLNLFFFFLISLLTFMILNYFFKPFEKKENIFLSKNIYQKDWKW
uniref:ATP synthase complex subunit 8 n=1 Tax=Homola orientalis TaxID=1550542 RepID=A0A191B606_9EUCA|nr:ATP synthase subunit 8 [Homola orientalis]